MCSKDVKRISGRLAIFIRLEAKPLVLRWKLQHCPWLQLPYHWAYEKAEAFKDQTVSPEQARDLLFNQSADTLKR